MNTLRFMQGPNHNRLKHLMVPALAAFAVASCVFTDVESVIASTAAYAKNVFTREETLPDTLPKWEPTDLECEGRVTVTLQDYNVGTVYGLMANRAVTAGSTIDPAAAVEEIRVMNYEPGDHPFDPSVVRATQEFDVPAVCRASEQ